MLSTVDDQVCSLGWSKSCKVFNYIVLYVGDDIYIIVINVDSIEDKWNIVIWDLAVLYPFFELRLMGVHEALKFDVFVDAVANFTEVWGVHLISF